MTQDVNEQHSIVDQLLSELKRTYYAGQRPSYAQLKLIAPALSLEDYKLLVQRFMEYMREQELQMFKDQEKQLTQTYPCIPEHFTENLLYFEQGIFSQFARFLVQRDQSIAQAVAQDLEQQRKQLMLLTSENALLKRENHKLQVQIDALENSLSRLDESYQFECKAHQQALVELNKLRESEGAGHLFVKLLKQHLDSPEIAKLSKNLSHSTAEALIAMLKRADDEPQGKAADKAQARAQAQAEYEALLESPNSPVGQGLGVSSSVNGTLSQSELIENSDMGSQGNLNSGFDQDNGNLDGSLNATLNQAGGSRGAMNALGNPLNPALGSSLSSSEVLGANLEKSLQNMDGAASSSKNLFMESELAKYRHLKVDDLVSLKQPQKTGDTNSANLNLASPGESLPNSNQDLKGLTPAFNHSLSGSLNGAFNGSLANAFSGSHLNSLGQGSMGPGSLRQGALDQEAMGQGAMSQPSLTGSGLDGMGVPFNLEDYAGKQLGMDSSQDEDVEEISSEDVDDVAPVEPVGTVEDEGDTEEVKDPEQLTALTDAAQRLPKIESDNQDNSDNEEAIKAALAAIVSNEPLVDEDEAAADAVELAESTAHENSQALSYASDSETKADSVSESASGTEPELGAEADTELGAGADTEADLERPMSSDPVSPEVSAGSAESANPDESANSAGTPDAEANESKLSSNLVAANDAQRDNTSVASAAASSTVSSNASSAAESTAGSANAQTQLVDPFAALGGAQQLTSASQILAALRANPMASWGVLSANNSSNNSNNNDDGGESSGVQPEVKSGTQVPHDLSNPLERKIDELDVLRDNLFGENDSEDVTSMEIESLIAEALKQNIFSPQEGDMCRRLVVKLMFLGRDAVYPKDATASNDELLQAIPNVVQRFLAQAILNQPQPAANNAEAANAEATKAEVSHDESKNAASDESKTKQDEHDPDDDPEPPHGGGKPVEFELADTDGPVEPVHGAPVEFTMQSDNAKNALNLDLENQAKPQFEHTAEPQSEHQAEAKSEQSGEPQSEGQSPAESDIPASENANEANLASKQAHSESNASQDATQDEPNPVGATTVKNEKAQSDKTSGSAAEAGVSVGAGVGAEGTEISIAETPLDLASLAFSWGKINVQSNKSAASVPKPVVPKSSTSGSVSTTASAPLAQPSLGQTPASNVSQSSLFDVTDTAITANTAATANNATNTANTAHESDANPEVDLEIAAKTDSAKTAETVVKAEPKSEGEPKAEVKTESAAYAQDEVAVKAQDETLGESASAENLESVEVVPEISSATAISSTPQASEPINLSIPEEKGVSVAEATAKLAEQRANAQNAALAALAANTANTANSAHASHSNSNANANAYATNHRASSEGNAERGLQAVLQDMAEKNIQPAQVLNSAPRSLVRDESTLVKEISTPSGDDSIAAVAAATAKLESIASLINENRQDSNSDSDIMFSFNQHEGTNVSHVGSLKSQNEDQATAELAQVAQDVLKVASELDAKTKEAQQVPPTSIFDRSYAAPAVPNEGGVEDEFVSGNTRSEDDPFGRYGTEVAESAMGKAPTKTRVYQKEESTKDEGSHGSVTLCQDSLNLDKPKQSEINLGNLGTGDSSNLAQGAQDGASLTLANAPAATSNLAADLASSVYTGEGNESIPWLNPDGSSAAELEKAAQEHSLEYNSASLTTKADSKAESKLAISKQDSGYKPDHEQNPGAFSSNGTLGSNGAHGSVSGGGTLADDSLENLKGLESLKSLESEFDESFIGGAFSKQDEGVKQPQAVMYPTSHERTPLAKEHVHNIETENTKIVLTPDEPTVSLLDKQPVADVDVVLNSNASTVVENDDSTKITYTEPVLSEVKAEQALEAAEKAQLAASAALDTATASVLTSASASSTLAADSATSKALSPVQSSGDFEVEMQVVKNAEPDMDVASEVKADEHAAAVTAALTRLADSKKDQLSDSGSAQALAKLTESADKAGDIEIALEVRPQPEFALASNEDESVDNTTSDSVNSVTSDNVTSEGDTSDGDSPDGDTSDSLDEANSAQLDENLTATAANADKAEPAEQSEKVEDAALAENADATQGKATQADAAQADENTNDELNVSAENKKPAQLIGFALNESPKVPADTATQVEAHDNTANVTNTANAANENQDVNSDNAAHTTKDDSVSDKSEETAQANELAQNQAQAQEQAQADETVSGNKPYAADNGKGEQSASENDAQAEGYEAKADNAKGDEAKEADNADEVKANTRASDAASGNEPANLPVINNSELWSGALKTERQKLTVDEVAKFKQLYAQVQELYRNKEQELKALTSRLGGSSVATVDPKALYLEALHEVEAKHQGEMSTRLKAALSEQTEADCFPAQAVLEMSHNQTTAQTVAALNQVNQLKSQTDNHKLQSALSGNQVQPTSVDTVVTRMPAPSSPTMTMSQKPLTQSLDRATPTVLDKDKGTPAAQAAIGSQDLSVKSAVKHFPDEVTPYEEHELSKFQSESDFKRESQHFAAELKALETKPTDSELSSSVSKAEPAALDAHSAKADNVAQIGDGGQNNPNIVVDLSADSLQSDGLKSDISKGDIFADKAGAMLEAQQSGSQLSKAGEDGDALAIHGENDEVTLLHVLNEQEEMEPMHTEVTFSLDANSQVPEQPAEPESNDSMFSLVQDDESNFKVVQPDKEPKTNKTHIKWQTRQEHDANEGYAPNHFTFDPKPRKAPTQTSDATSGLTSGLTGGLTGVNSSGSSILGTLGPGKSAPGKSGQNLAGNGLPTSSADPYWMGAMGGGLEPAGKPHVDTVVTGLPLSSERNARGNVFGNGFYSNGTGLGGVFNPLNLSGSKFGTPGVLHKGSSADKLSGQAFGQGSSSLQGSGSSFNQSGSGGVKPTQGGGWNKSEIKSNSSNISSRPQTIPQFDFAQHGAGFNLDSPKKDKPVHQPIKWQEHPHE